MLKLVSIVLSKSLVFTNFQKHSFQYRCKCQAEHWNSGGSGWLTGATLIADDSGPLTCTPCGMGSDSTACLTDAHRVAVLAGNVGGMLLCLVTGVIIFHKRKCKVSYVMI